ncbi:MULTISPECIES: hypothetical protein [Vibrio]|uniref:hypothetical protein n=1 Tax=Vibrio TaxID=662 RepID=UPI00102A457D|nr:MULTISPECIES: hypothetical protein [Vibrio]MCU8193736.1 hypothetical protein [Vibrio vulnificus]MDK2617364.1 hypothetical protein [Vibrio vulnificus]MDK2674381.1 hypothetical protein [Vibrio vulnificus]RZR07166.1 hypothetical protein D8T43_14945 [Vibrio vulnificus]TOG46385.1 hypothetical protein CGJ00_19350 [Vibrio parahaemolyticus]
MSNMSWALTQHAKVINDDFQKFAELAYRYRGQKDFSEALNADIIDAGILTENSRDGQISPWRDYQQVLPTLGCIVSTKTEPTLTFTPIGKLVAKGGINFSEFITLQALRLQYPNGNTISNGIYASQLELGIRVKPGLLILDTLVELQSLGEGVPATISTDECQHFLVSNIDNTLDLDSIVSAKSVSNNKFKASRNSSARRNVQDWFQLMAKTSLIDVSKRTSSAGGASELKLSKVAIDNLEQVKLLIKSIKAEGYWEPSNRNVLRGKPSKEVRLEWFEYFGSLPDEKVYSLWLPQSEILPDPEDEPMTAIDGVGEPSEIRLGNVLDSITTYKGGYEGSATGKSGIEARLKASALHEKMILALNNYFLSHGYETRADADSVDLLALKGDESILLEGKTTNDKNLAKQIRSAIGQLLEYKYRLGIDPALVIAVSSPLKVDSFYTKFLHNLGISVAVVQGDNVRFLWVNEV